MWPWAYIKGSGLLFNSLKFAKNIFNQCVLININCYYLWLTYLCSLINIYNFGKILRGIYELNMTTMSKYAQTNELYYIYIYYYIIRCLFLFTYLFVFHLFFSFEASCLMIVLHSFIYSIRLRPYRQLILKLNNKHIHKNVISNTELNAWCEAFTVF